MLKEVGLKITGPRTKILNILENNKDLHLSAEAIYKKLLEQDDEVNIATIYRVLTQFEAAGIIKKHNFDNDHSVFEIDDGSHHDHIVCIKCNTVKEFTNDIIEKEQKIMAEKLGFELTEHCLYLYGICSTCNLRDPI